MWIWGNNEINLLGPSVTDALVFKPTKLQIENTAVDTLCFGLHWVAALSGILLFFFKYNVFLF